MKQRLIIIIIIIIIILAIRISFRDSEWILATANEF